MDIGNIALPTLLMGVGGGLLYSLRSVPKWIYNKVKAKLMYTVKVYDYDQLFEMIEEWLSQYHHGQYRDVEATFKEEGGENFEFLVPSSENRWREIKSQKCGATSRIAYKQEENVFSLKYLEKRIFVSKGREKNDKAQNSKDRFFRKYTISGFKAKDQINELLDTVICFHMSKKESNALNVFCNDSAGYWHKSGALKVKPLEKTIINESKKQFLLKDIEDFVCAEKWYSDVSIPYKRGYCFYGPPGTGKTTLALGLANHLKRNIFCLNLNCIDDDGKLPGIFRDIAPNSVLVIEDIDKVFSGRDNVKEDSKLTFSSLLNCLDGAHYKHGLITIITTNHVDKLDGALLRTGRVDVKIEITRPSYKEISEYVSLFYNSPLEIKGEFDITMSDVQEICLRNKDCPDAAMKELLSNIKK